ncbi:hypothetical protein DEO72_LG10g613 [Vigna unguiculata]|uniref:Uncharacterized protein n=1 Tax=Vigna unguiculata TaxID=3917 RepID=A0A4D6N9D0_VIGUN|nr:hypothetical protein DEO72_LG10g613 [Vigna unguiculata]
MSTESSEREGSPQSEGVITSPKEGEKEDYLKQKLIIQPIVEEIEECKTPTWSSRNKVATILECPPAPRKIRPSNSSISSQMMRALTIDDHNQLNFCEEVEPMEVELFFQSINDFNRINK